ncbi:hypothetical protein BD779DRAFT_1474862 [Infundibulicybe gibba]|nr:hypothetical protein BD779DRAFT_1474862 [Infundibulicybe gibba]
MTEISKYQFEFKFERILGPTSPRSTESRRHSFGCNDLDDFSRLVEKNWDRRSPREWNRVKHIYHKTKCQILPVLGVIGLVFSATMGAVNRVKLRNAINSIIRKLKDKKFNEPIQEDMKGKNYYNMARSLRNLDESREPWVNGNPNRQTLDNMLQMLETSISAW